MTITRYTRREGKIEKEKKKSKKMYPVISVPVPHISRDKGEKTEKREQKKQLALVAREKTNKHTPAKVKHRPRLELEKNPGPRLEK